MSDKLIQLDAYLDEQIELSKTYRMGKGKLGFLKRAGQGVRSAVDTVTGKKVKGLKERRTKFRAAQSKAQASRRAKAAKSKYNAEGFRKEGEAGWRKRGSKEPLKTDPLDPMNWSAHRPAGSKGKYGEKHAATQRSDGFFTRKKQKAFEQEAKRLEGKSERARASVATGRHSGKARDAKYGKAIRSARIKQVGAIGGLTATGVGAAGIAKGRRKKEDEE